MLLWHTLATYFRRKYGVRVQKIPLDAGATCPNRDGTLSARGCIFCNDSGSGSGMGLRGLGLRAQWDAWYTKYTTTDSDRLFMAYLQSFSNTYGPASRLAHLLEQVAALPGCRGIAVGTRPDCLDGEKLALLAGCGLDEVWLELGLQTCRDDTLRRINRGHTARQAEEAVRAALDAGLPEGRVIDMVKKDNLTLQRPRIELQFLPEKYTRTGRVLGVRRTALQQERTRELYEVVQTVNANVLADDRPWLEAFSLAFAAALPRGGNDSRGNWVRVRAQQATFGRSPDKRVGHQVIEVFTRVNRLFVISFTWRITGKEAEVLIPTFTIKPKLG